MLKIPIHAESTCSIHHVGSFSSSSSSTTRLQLLITFPWKTHKQHTSPRCCWPENWLIGEGSSERDESRMKFYNLLLWLHMWAPKKKTRTSTPWLALTCGAVGWKNIEFSTRLSAYVPSASEMEKKTVSSFSTIDERYLFLEGWILYENFNIIPVQPWFFPPYPSRSLVSFFRHHMLNLFELHKTEPPFDGNKKPNLMDNSWLMKAKKKREIFDRVCWTRPLDCIRNEIQFRWKLLCIREARNIHNQLSRHEIFSWQRRT